MIDNEILSKEKVQKLLTDLESEQIERTINEWIKREELLAAIGLSNHSKYHKTYLDPLIDLNWIQMEFRETKTHPNQRYKTTLIREKIGEFLAKHRLK